MAIFHYVGVAEPVDTGWSISFPSFPGTVTTGESLHHLMVEAKDALASVVDAMQEDGMALPAALEQGDGGLVQDLSDYSNPQSVLIPVDVRGASIRVNISMDDSLLARVDELSKRQATSRSALLARGARMLLASEQDGLI